MRRTLFFLLLLGLPASVQASWAYVPAEKLVQESDLIVVGTLRDVKEHTADGRDYGEGRIDVHEVIWGDVAAGGSLLLKWDNASDNICPRVEHKWDADKEGIWLLTRDGEAVRADYPGRFVVPSRRAEVLAALSASPVVLRSESYTVGRDNPLTFTVVYRNASDAPRTFPGVVALGPNLFIDRASRLDVNISGAGGVERPAKLADGAVLDINKTCFLSAVVEARSERRVEVRLRELLKTAPKDHESYDITLRLAGLPPSNELEFYIDNSYVPKTRAEAAPPPAPVVNYERHFVAPAARRELTPLTRAALAALAALLLFPFFHWLRASLAGARFARATQGTETWQI